MGKSKKIDAKIFNIIRKAAQNPDDAKAISALHENLQKIEEEYGLVELLLTKDSAGHIPLVVAFSGLAEAKASYRSDPTQAFNTNVLYPLLTGDVTDNPEFELIEIFALQQLHMALRIAIETNDAKLFDQVLDGAIPTLISYDNLISNLMNAKVLQNMQALQSFNAFYSLLNMTTNAPNTSLTTKLLLTKLNKVLNEEAVQYLENPTANKAIENRLAAWSYLDPNHKRQVLFDSIINGNEDIIILAYKHDQSYFDHASIAHLVLRAALSQTNTKMLETLRHFINIDSKAVLAALKMQLNQKLENEEHIIKGESIPWLINYIGTEENAIEFARSLWQRFIHHNKPTRNVDVLINLLSFLNLSPDNLDKYMVEIIRFGDGELLRKFISTYAIKNNIGASKFEEYFLYACANASEEIVAELSIHVKNINCITPDRASQSALQIATAHSRPEILHFLISRGADISYRSNEGFLGYKATSYARGAHKNECLAILYRADILKRETDQFYRVAASGSRDELLRFLPETGGLPPVAKVKKALRLAKQGMQPDEITNTLRSYLQRHYSLFDRFNPFDWIRSFFKNGEVTMLTKVVPMRLNSEQGIALPPAVTFNRLPGPILTLLYSHFVTRLTYLDQLQAKTAELKGYATHDISALIIELKADWNQIFTAASTQTTEEFCEVVSKYLEKYAQKQVASNKMDKKLQEKRSNVLYAYKHPEQIVENEEIALIKVCVDELRNTHRSIR